MNEKEKNEKSQRAKKEPKGKNSDRKEPYKDTSGS